MALNVVRSVNDIMLILKELPINRIVKKIELKDMIIVRYRNPLIKKPIYRIYYIDGRLARSGIDNYRELLVEIRNVRYFNRIL